MKNENKNNARVSYSIVKGFTNLYLEIEGIKVPIEIKTYGKPQNKKLLFKLRKTIDEVK